MKNTLDEILAYYENKNENEVMVDVESSTEDGGMTEADYELWEYLCGSGDIQHLYNYYDLRGWNNN